MIKLLEHQKQNVEKAKQRHTAATAYANHCSKQAKKDVTNLLLSPKGITAAFSAGVAKEIMKSENVGNTQSDMTKTAFVLATKLIPMWLSD